MTGQGARPSDDIWFNWNTVDVGAASHPPAYSGTFFDETLRDGLQAPHIRNPSVDQKLVILDHMARAGVRSADLGFPGSDPEALNECVQLARHIIDSGYQIVPGYAGRTHPADIAAICEIAERAGTTVDAYLFIGVSPIRQYVEDWSIATIQRSIVNSAAACLHSDVDFVLVLEDAVRCTPEVLGQVYDAAIDSGVTRLTLCDTVGAARPEGTAALLHWTNQYFASRQRSVALEWHGHNDRGLALANSLTALALGCARVHGTILGIGERAGNASLDQLMINSHLDGREAYDLRALGEYGAYASEVLNVGIPQNYPALGRDVFKTSAGVHASAILKAHQKGNTLVKDSVYSSVPASYLGREQEVLIDEASGTNNVRYWLTVHGYDSTDASLLKKILAGAKSNRGPLTDEQIGQIIATAE
ncbi:LeuA family protein [Streptomyces sp. QL37]|uniref:LeuA family protein n=1 Tax=Streptomyces sp. QL37 TaxID=2093747 RepID=UPI000CF2ADE4|nr:LeuA family protein [Streptomyces sp. QL37]PPQ60230.1 2-isopropylmalate synthase [Streptomyces sp. QL37]